MNDPTHIPHSVIFSSQILVGIDYLFINFPDWQCKEVVGIADPFYLTPANE